MQTGTHVHTLTPSSTFHSCLVDNKKQRWPMYDSTKRQTAAHHRSYCITQTLLIFPCFMTFLKPHCTSLFRTICTWSMRCGEFQTREAQKGKENASHNLSIIKTAAFCAGFQSGEKYTGLWVMLRKWMAGYTFPHLKHSGEMRCTATRQHFAVPATKSDWLHKATLSEKLVH